jgi:hypothetical protein
MYNVLHLQDKLGAFIVRKKVARSSIQPGRVSMGPTFRRPSLGHFQSCTVTTIWSEWVTLWTGCMVWKKMSSTEKNCKHQVPDDGDAGNGLKQLMKEPLDRSKFVGPILFV